MTTASQDLTELRRRVRYEPDTGHFYWICATRRGRGRFGERAGRTRPDGYRVVIIDGRQYLEHRLAWAFMHGDLPLQRVDHRDGNRSNNAIENLRLATGSQNSANSKKSWSNSGRRGVHWHKTHRKWMAHIRVSGRSIHLGYHATAEDAALARDEAAKLYFGEFAPC